jgi:uncharacterized protein (TIGR03435 family)
MSTSAELAANMWRYLWIVIVAFLAFAEPCLVIPLSRPLLAQSPTTIGQVPTFDVASVKPNKSGPGERRADFQPGGRFISRNMPLRNLIAFAYGTPLPLRPFQVVAGPSWVDTDGFDIEAKPSSDLSETRGRSGYSVTGELMLRSLLADRFKLQAHDEVRELPVYALVMARRDGKLGPQLRRSTGDDCVTAAPGGGSSTPLGVDASQPCGSVFFTPPQRMSVRSAPIEIIVRFLQNAVADRVVLDRTGLTGSFSMDLEYAREQPSLPRSPGVPAPIEQNGPSIFTAIQEQLGLKLESTRGPVTVIVIDHVERPTED